MYNFAILVMLGLLVWKLAEFLLGLSPTRPSSTVRTVGTLALGVAGAEILGYDVFAGWGADFREAWMGPLATGLVIGAMAYVWDSVLRMIDTYGQRRDDAGAPEQRTPRAA